MTTTNPTPDPIDRRAVLEAIDGMLKAHNDNYLVALWGRIAALPACPVAVAPEAPQPALDVAGLVQKQQDFLAEQLRQQLSACREQLLVLANENDTLATQLAEAERELENEREERASAFGYARDMERAANNCPGCADAEASAAAAEKALAEALKSLEWGHAEMKGRPPQHWLDSLEAIRRVLLGGAG